MPVTTLFNSSNLSPSNLPKQSFASAIARYQPNGQSPLFALSSMLKSETAINTQHGYFAKSMIFPTVQLNGAIADGAATAFTVDDTSVTGRTPIIPGMVLRVASTLENILVVSVTSATAFVAKRGVGSVSAAAIADDTVLYMIGTAYEEASNRPSPYSIDTVAVSNYTQIFRNAWAVSGSAAAVQVIAGEKVEAENKMDCMGFHGRDIEFMSLWGQQKNTTHPTNGKPLRFSEGVYGNLHSNSLTSNIVTLGASTNFTQLENALDVCFNTALAGQAPSERLLLVGGVTRRVINNIGRLNSSGAGWELSGGETSFGLQFESFKCARGTFHMIEHPLLNAYGPNAPQASTAFAVHLPTINFAYLGGRDTKAEDYTLGGSVMQGSATDQSGVDAMGGSLTSELCAMFKNPSANAIISNFTAASIG